ncbi:MAG: hypothetical protein RI924_1281, partial [Bacteroidota bacterium]
RIPHFFYLLLLFCCITFSVQAQSISLDNIQNLKVDQISDTDLQLFQKKLQSSGISLDNALQLLYQRGMKATEIDKLKKRLSGVMGSKQNGLAAKADSINYVRQELIIEPSSFVDVQSEIYGASFFNNPKLSFEPNLRIATPQTYVLGADDELIIILSGLNESSVKTRVSPDGNVQIPYAGLVFVNGLSIEQASVRIKEKMKRVYPALASGQTNLTISLGNIRSIRVNIIGEAKQPGTYTVSSLSTLSNVLYQSGGPNANGSLRNIEIIRNNKVYRVVDFYQFLQKGLLSTNVRLEDQDVIRFPFYQKRIILNGEVKMPASYELKEGENLKHLIDLGGGFRDGAYKAMVKVYQKGDVELKVKDVPQDFYANYVPLNGDSVYIGKISNRYTNRIFIKGAIQRPDTYELTEGLRLSALIKHAGGLKEDALLGRGYINRIKADLSKQTVSFDLGKIMKGTAEDLILQREDEVYILSSKEMGNELSVSISGLVKQPGTYTYREGMQLADLVAMAGGFNYNAANHRIEISRILPNKSDEVANQLVETFTVKVDSNLLLNQEAVYLQALDKITVPQLVNYQVLGNVNIGGEVLFPGNYALQRRDETIMEMLNRAGGLSPAASLENVQIYRNGLRVDAELSGRAKERKLILLPQDSIFVPKDNPFVEVVGGVNTPQLFRYKSSRFTYYVNAAGGTKNHVRIKNAYVAYPNGINRPVKRFLFFKNYPRISKGSRLVIPQPEPELRVKLGVGEISAAASILTALVSVIAILTK